MISISNGTDLVAVQAATMLQGVALSANAGRTRAEPGTPDPAARPLSEIERALPPVQRYFELQSRVPSGELAPLDALKIWQRGRVVTDQAQPARSAYGRASGLRGGSGGKDGAGQDGSTALIDLQV